MAGAALAGGLAILLLLGPNLIGNSPSKQSGGPLGLGSSVARGKGALPSEDGRQRFRSRPDLSVPVVKVDRPARRTAPGYVFVAPKSDGAMILDNRGKLVWYREGSISNFRVQTYRGKPALTWWQDAAGKRGRPSYVIANSRYRTIRRFKAANGYGGDLHEYLLLPNGHALITAYHAVPRDLSSLGGRGNGVVLDSIAQEIDLKRGRLVWEWHSLDHVPLSESFNPAGRNPEAPYDYFHINSIEPTPDGNILISGRDTWTVYKVSRRTGRIIWRLGGKRSDFRIGRGAKFAWQHDAHLGKRGRIEIFDNSDAPPARKPLRGRSRAVVLKIDWRKRRASLKRRYLRPGGGIASTQGNVQALPNRNVFVGWGSEPYCSEFAPKGRVRFEFHFEASSSSYRCFRMPWVGRPAERPAIASEAQGQVVRAWASWNGDTRVATWRLLAGSSPDNLKAVGSARRRGFETEVKATTIATWVAMEGLDRKGKVLRRTPVAKVGEQAR